MQKAGYTSESISSSLEFEAIKWQTRVDCSMRRMTDAQIWERVNRVYWGLHNHPQPGSQNRWRNTMSVERNDVAPDRNILFCPGCDDLLEIAQFLIS